MKFARIVLLVALHIMIVCANVPAQTSGQDTDSRGCIVQLPGRREDDPRNLSPSVGTGGPEGGATGLFTIYDGQTLRRGEFTFSVAYSNFDRDPGNLDIVETPISFNVGLSDYIELFVKVTGYKGIKANSPLNLSGFYLPNSRVFFGNNLLGSPPAIILAPSGTNVGTIRGTAVFRPPFCAGCTPLTTPGLANFFTAGQPFAQYPFTGQPGPNFALSPSTGTGPGSGQGGFPGFNAVLGPPVATANNGTFGSAAAFPGVGSPLGSILPGVVLATTTLPPTVLSASIVVPTTYTIAPAYYPGAPFLNRLYGESAFTDIVGGAKIRFTEPDNPLGFGVMPMYRYWWDKGDDVSGFNQMQRGAGPGGDIGDFGLVVFLDGRLSRSVNVSVNGGYWLNSNPKDPAGFVLLDRPDEVIAGIGFDFPVNKWFQPIFELRSTQYVGGRTPNAFENSPVEFTAGTKIYPRRWWGMGFWYRRHINQQRRNLFEGANFTETIRQITNVDPSGPPATVFVVPATTRSATTNEFPTNFQFSDDSNGFGFQLFVGRRKARVPSVLPNCPPTVDLNQPPNVRVPVPPRDCEIPGQCPPPQVPLTATASDPDGDTLFYEWMATGGRVTGEGANVTWDLTGVAPGTYTATVTVDDGCGCIVTDSTTIIVEACPATPLNPTVSISCPTDAGPGQPATFTANVQSADPSASVTYNWAVSTGTISSGQGTSSITVLCPEGGGTITATVEVVVDRCPPITASCSTTCPTVGCRLFDSYGAIQYNDEKARLDNLAIQLQGEPGSTVYVYGYTGGTNGQNIGTVRNRVVGDNIPAEYRLNRAVRYLVDERGVSPERIICVNAGVKTESSVELWLCPLGKSPAMTSDQRVQDCRTPSTMTGTTGRGRARGRRSRRR